MKNLVDVLVVDDQPGMRQMLSSVVSEAGYKVYLAQNGLEAIKMVLKIRPQLVFMDIKMPVMDGLEALSEIMAVAPETKVIMMTAYISEEIIRQVKEKGARCCLTKPFEIEEIKSILKNHW
jgi:two-component system response regulator (stage 0 sporulation protein F)